MIPRELPTGWKEVQIGEVLKFEYGKGLPKDRRKKNGEFPVYGSSGIVGYHNHYLVNEDCIVVGRKGSIGSVFLSLNPCWPIDTTYYVKNVSSLNIKFLYYHLSYINLKIVEKSTAIPGLSRDDIYVRRIILPPLEEQRQIAEIIEELFSELDAGRRQLESVKEQLKTYRQAVLKTAFEGGLSKNQIAEYENCSAWEITKIVDVGEIVSGGTPSTKETDYWDGDIPWITPADLSGYSNKYIDKGRRSITYKGLSKSSARMIPSGSVLLSSRAPIGYVAIAKNELCTNQGFKSIIPSSRVTSEYLYYFLKARTQKIIERASGTTFKEVSLKTISSLEIIIPPIKQQKIIVAEIEHRFSFCDKMEETIFDNIQRSETLKQSILKQAFKGKLIKHKQTKQIIENEFIHNHK